VLEATALPAAPLPALPAAEPLAPAGEEADVIPLSIALEIDEAAEWTSDATEET